MARTDEWYLICRRCHWSVRVPVPPRQTGWAQERPRIPKDALTAYLEHWYDQHGERTS